MREAIVRIESRAAVFVLCSIGVDCCFGGRESCCSTGRNLPESASSSQCMVHPRCGKKVPGTNSTVNASFDRLEKPERTGNLPAIPANWIGCGKLNLKQLQNYASKLLLKEFDRDPPDARAAESLHTTAGQ